MMRPERKRQIPPKIDPSAALESATLHDPPLAEVVDVYIEEAGAWVPKAEWERYNPVENALLLLGCPVVTWCLRLAQWKARKDLVRE